MMHRFAVTAWAGVISLTISTLANAGNYVDKGGRYSIVIPDTWQISSEPFPKSLCNGTRTVIKVDQSSLSILSIDACDFTGDKRLAEISRHQDLILNRYNQWKRLIENLPDQDAKEKHLRRFSISSTEEALQEEKLRLLSGGFYDAWLSDLSEVAKVTKKGAAIRSQFESLPALRQDVDILKKNSNQIIRGYAIAANKADILYFIAVTGSPDRIAEIEKSLATFSIP